MGISDINICNFSKTLTNDIVSFEQLGPECSVLHDDIMVSVALVWPNG